VSEERRPQQRRWAARAPKIRSASLAASPLLRTQGSSAPRAQEHPVQGIDLFEDDAGAANDAGQRILGDSYWHERFVRDELVEPREQRAATADHDPALNDVLDQLRRC